MKYYSLGSICKLSIDLNSAEFRCKGMFFFHRCHVEDVDL